MPNAPRGRGGLDSGDGESALALGPADARSASSHAARSLSVGEIADRLIQFGLERSEADTFVHLVRAGPSKASAVAAGLGMQRTVAYRVLQRLVDKGYVSASLSRPVLYEAVAVSVVFERVLAGYRHRMDGVRLVQEELTRAFSMLKRSPAAPAARPAFRIVQGRPEVHELVLEMIQAARLRMWCVSTSEAGLAVAEAAGVCGALEERAVAGLDVRAMFRVPHADRARLCDARWAQDGTLRHVEETRPMQFVIVDDSLVLWAVRDPSTRLNASGDVAVWTDSVDLVAAHAVLFEFLRAEAVPVSAEGGVASTASSPGNGGGDAAAIAARLGDAPAG